MRSPENHIQKGLTATGQPFLLFGGTYSLSAIVHSHSGLTANLAVLGADGSTYQNLITDLTANGVTAATAPLYLPQGSYEFVVTGTPGGSESWDMSLTRVPAE